MERSYSTAIKWTFLKSMLYLFSLGYTNTESRRKDCEHMELFEFTKERIRKCILCGS